MLDVPGLTPDKIRKIHDALGIETLEELETAARNGQLASLPRFGPKTAERILKGIVFLRSRGSLRLYHHALIEARQFLAMVQSHPDVDRAEVAGAVRRRREVAGVIDIVAACTRSPVDVAQSFTRIAGVKASDGRGSAVTIRFVDGGQLELQCVEPPQYGVALWRATGSDEHVAEIRDRLAANGFGVDDDWLRDADDRTVPAPDEDIVYRAAGVAYIEPELREGLGETEAAARGSLPSLIVPSDIRGVLHCHSHYSDGKASVAEMARAAQERGWSYIGISDHSQSAFYASGMSRERILAQHEEIDDLNTRLVDFRILKGIEADILADGRLDYDDEILDRFDYVIGSIHSRFAMGRAAMTERVLKALDDPRLTVLAHPTGRLLLSREPYDLDLDAILERAREVGAAVELNADPHRLDLDWRHLRRAKALRVPVAIGPDAHSTNALDTMEIGVGIARKAWLEPQDVLNSRPADDVLAFARRRRERRA
jgi:DNA polymerase (family 10)